MVRLMLGFLLCVISVVGNAQSPRPGAAWYEAGHVLLGVTEPAVGFSGSWQFDRADNGDVRVIKDEQRVGTSVSGTVMSVCNDRALLIKGLKPARKKELAELDGPVLMLQLALRLLERGMPQGPTAVENSANFDLSETVNAIRVSKGTSVRAEFLAPWRLRGKVERIAPDQFKFDLVFVYANRTAADRRFEMNLVGLWQKASRVAVFEQEMPITDWQVYRVDVVSRIESGTAVFGQGVIPAVVRFRNLGQLRARLERNWDPAGGRQMECKL